MAPYGAGGFVQSKVRSNEVSPNVRRVSQNSEQLKFNSLECLGRSSAVNSKNYPQAQPKKYCIHCVLKAKAQVQSSAVVSKER